MPRRKRLPEPTAPPRRLRRWLLQFLAAVLGCGLLVAGMAWLVPVVREMIQGGERHQAAFADIECNPPSPLTRGEFLDDVQFYSELPDRFSVLEPGLESKLQAGFARHPWVLSAVATLRPPHGVTLTVVYREPALAVTVPPDFAGPPADPS